MICAIYKNVFPVAYRALAFFALVLVSGCEHFDPKPLNANQNADRLDSRSLTNSSLRTFVEQNLHKDLPSALSSGWNLDSLTWAAFYYHPSLEVARAQWAVARGGEETAAQRPNPVLTASPSYNTTTLTPSPWLMIATLDVPIETAGKRGYRREHAAFLAEAARLNIAGTAYKVRSDVRTSVVELAGAEARSKLIENELSVREELVHRMEQEVQAGLIPVSDALPWRLALERARLDAADSRRLAVEARARLAESVGLPLTALGGAMPVFDLTGPGPSTRDLTSSFVRREALLSRPDILTALAEYKAAESGLRLEIAKQYPDIHLQPGYEFDQGDNKWGLGFSLELPVLSHNLGPIAEARARRQEAAARFNALQAKVIAEVDRAVELLQVAESNLGLSRGLTKTAALRLHNAEAQFNAGAVDRTEVLTVRLEAVSANIMELDGQVRFQRALGALENAVQRPLELPSELFQSTHHDSLGIQAR